MSDTVRLQSTAMRAVGAATVATAALVAAGLAIGAEWGTLLAYAGPLGLVGLVGVAACWLPYVDVSHAGVEVRNVLRTVHVSWPAIEEIDGRYGLRLRTAYGTVNAWGATAPSGRQRLRGGDSVAAATVRQWRDRLRAQGHLDDPRLESERLPVRWHGRLLAVGGALVALTALGLLLG